MATAAPARKRTTGGKRPPEHKRRTAANATAAHQKALAHPLRIQIMQTIDQGTKSPSELAEVMDVPLPNLSYHIRMLVTLGFLKLVKTRPRRGAIEHYYTTTGKWNQWAPLRPGVVDVELVVLRKIVRDLAKRHPDKQRVQFTTDGDELLLNLSGIRYRIFPDCSIVEENPEDGQTDGDQ